MDPSTKKEPISDSGPEIKGDDFLPRGLRRRQFHRNKGRKGNTPSGHSGKRKIKTRSVHKRKF